MAATTHERRRRLAWAAGVGCAVLSAATSARAQDRGPTAAPSTPRVEAAPWPPPYAPATPPPAWGPARRPYVEGQPIPPGYHLETHSRPGFLIPGGLLLGVPYVVGLAVATGLDFQYGTGWFALPIAGPWVVIFSNRTSCDSTSDTSGECEAKQFLKSIAWIYLAADSLLQAAGTVLLMVGWNGRTLLVRDSLARVMITPAPIGRSGYGAVLTARF